MGKVLVLLVLLMGLVGGGYYNYQRNAPMDADLQEQRPYRAIPSADLAKLIMSAQKDIARAKGAVASAPHGASAIDAQDASDVGGKAKAFAGFQRENERWKAQRGRVMEQEAELKPLLFEKSIRDRHLDDPQYVFKKRLLSF
jgi:hypothetical protein